MKKSLRYLLLIVAALALAAISATAQKKTEEKSLECRDSYTSNRLKAHCEIKEQTLPVGAISVDGRRNGGVAVKGWDRNEILARYRIQTTAPTQAEADQLAKEIRVETAGRRIHAEGPEGRDDRYWDVSYEVFVPRRTDVSLEAQNGGITINDVQGKLEFRTQNGGVHLRGVGGSVRGGTTNGGVHIELTGARWEGEGLDVKTTNGGVNMSLPGAYSAHLETGTVNGRVSFGFPVNVPSNERGRYTREISVDLGSGGPTIRVMTTNGGVHVGRASVIE
jgi:Uncharacterized conserved protein